MVKVKKEESFQEDQQSERHSWEEKIQYLCPIARPLATKKLAKRLYKTIRKASQHKKHVKRGVREVVKFINKDEKMSRLVIIAGDVSPIDVIAHVPGLCEEKDIPYCYIPSKEDLGSACGSKRQTCVVMVVGHDEYQENFTDCVSGVKELPRVY